MAESFSAREQLEYFFNHFGTSEDKLALLGSRRFDGGTILGREDAAYFVFSKLVDFGHVCEASNVLFQRMKGIDDFDLAIKYMINSPNVDSSIVYNCGDEDLELLLD